eukprot:CAMPEP_0197536762 /NCGR_PEP_ID=MMETSP1318-20131121/54766_1 /TAXON_ID=552666 /ORGANISM="Partenskyella glossopodia, Strain RCC365" /LENGTH=32 /DNA_ID= /DNA_START= /DNA_END= /DNA_ORIENTATION=
MVQQVVRLTLNRTMTYGTTTASCWAALGVKKL